MRAVELNLTEQLFASLLGMRTIPSGRPIRSMLEPDTEEPGPSTRDHAEDMGYITVVTRSIQ